MTIKVTHLDIADSGQHPLENPITRAILRATGQPWVVFEGRSAHQLTAPFRAVALPYDVVLRWQQYQSLGTMEPFEFELDIDKAQQIHERRQRRGERRHKDRRFGDRRRSERRNRADRREHFAFTT